MMPGAREPSLPTFDDPEEDVDEAEFAEEDERVYVEILEHPTRDDLHEQRELRQKCEGVIHVCLTVARPLEPHGFDGTRSRLT